MLSTLIPKELAQEFKENSSHNMQDAANALQWNLYDGFCENLEENIKLFNVLPVDSFPQYYKKAFIKKSFFNNNCINIGFCNIKFLRNYFKWKKIYKVLKAWCEKTDEPKTLFVYTLSQPLIKAVNKIKKKYDNTIVCAIVADLPNMSSLSANKSFFQKVFTNFISSSSYSMLHSVDKFVLLTKQMADYMKISQPYIVVEGMVNSKSNNEENIGLSDKEKVIMYSGTLHKKFGVLHLLDSFSNIKGEEYRLLICGVGDSEQEIKKAQQKDSRIDFRGQLSRDEVLILQKQASVLVNPRLDNEEFTKYSFPSKTMEYLASGVPVVAYKLAGIPDEYDEYLNYPKDNSLNGLKDVLLKICEMPIEKRQKLGKKGQEFVLNNKNNINQAKKILEFIEDGKQK